MIILTKAECLAARFVVQDAAEHKELDAPTASILLGAIHDVLETIKLEPVRYVQLDA
jgi:hypothetical protein